MYSPISKEPATTQEYLSTLVECRIGFSQVPCYAYFLSLHVEFAGLIVKCEGLKEQGYCTVTRNVHAWCEQWGSTMVALLPLSELPEGCEVEPEQKLLQRVVFSRKTPVYCVKSYLVKDMFHLLLKLWKISLWLKNEDHISHHEIAEKLQW